MHHICTICQSPFLLDSDSATPDTETVVTTCGHIFHRDCIELRAKAEGSSCPTCSASFRKAEKFIKLFMSYDEDEDDRNLLRDVLSATAAELRAPQEQSSFVSLERKRKFLQEEHEFNQLQVNDLYRHVKEIEARSEAYGRRLKRIQAKIDETEAACKALEEQQEV